MCRRAGDWAGQCGAQAPPAGAPPAPDAKAPVYSQSGPPPPPPLSPVEKLVTALPPPQPGGGPPMLPLAADAPMPSADPHDLQGTWIHNQPLQFRMQRDMYGVLVPYNMEVPRCSRAASTR